MGELTEADGAKLPSAGPPVPAHTVREHDTNYATRIERPNVTRRVEPAPSALGEESLLVLPPVLRGRFTMERELGGGGGEADLVLVRDGTGQRYVIKIYRSGIALDRDVCEQLSAVDSRHVVKQWEIGHANGRDFEVLEYVAHGDLRTLIERRGGPFTPTEIANLVAQIADALAAIHRVNIVHRDLKPENLLLRSVAPVELALADFGVSRRLSATVHYTGVAHTPAYAPPESINGEASRPGDWWSLGMIVRELATGADLFAGLSPRAVLGHLISRPIPLEAVTDPRLRLLCAGLLVKDPADRWGGEQVTAWRLGQSPPVPESRPQPAAKPLFFAGRELFTKAEAAAVIAAHWSAARERFFPRSAATEGWQMLVDWMRQFDHSPAAADERIALVDGPLAARLDADAKLVLLLRWLAPDRPPAFRGREANRAELVRLVVGATDPGREDHRECTEALDSLWASRTLPVLAGFRGAAELAELDSDWVRLARRWDQWIGQLMRQSAESGRVLRPADELGWVRYLLLDLLLRPVERAASIERQALGLAASFGPRLPWFAQLCEEARGDAVRQLSIVLLGQLATEQVEGADLAKRQADERAAERERRWQALEEDRTSVRGRLLASLVALGGIALFALVTGGVVSLLNVAGEAAGAGPPRGDATTAVISAVVTGTVIGIELLFALLLGRDYPPRFSLAMGVLRAMRAVGTRIGAVFTSFGRVGCFGFVALICVGSWALSLMPWGTVGVALPRGTPYVVAGLGLIWLVWTVRRLIEWTAQHRELRQRVLAS